MISVFVIIYQACLVFRRQFFKIIILFNSRHIKMPFYFRQLREIFTGNRGKVIFMNSILLIERNIVFQLFPLEKLNAA